MDSFYSEIKAEATDETIIERSKFICLIKKVETEEEAREVLSVVKKITRSPRTIATLSVCEAARRDFPTTENRRVRRGNLCWKQSKTTAYTTS